MRVVLDTNVWVSGLLWGGPPSAVLRLAEEGRLELCVTPALLDELFGVLSRPKFQDRLGEVGLTIDELRSHVTELASVFEDPSKSETGNAVVLADPDDDRVIHCALRADARVIVSGDAHLLDLTSHRGIRILTVQEFLGACVTEDSGA